MRRLKLFLDAKAANTPPRGISKASRVIFSVLTLLLLSIGQMWATAYISYDGDTQDASTTISTSNVSSGEAGAISWTGTSCSYSSNRVNIAANGSIAFTATTGKIITKIVITSGSSEAYYGTWTSSPSVTPSKNGGVTTFDGLSANSVTVTTSTAFRCTNASDIKIYYTDGEEPGGGGQGGGTSASTYVNLSGGTFADSKITWTFADGNITISQLKGTSSTAVNGNYISAPRVYKGHILSFEATNGYKISSISIEYDGTYYGNSMTAGTAISNNTVTDNTTAVSRTWATTSGGTHVVSSVSEAGLSAIHIQNVATTNVQLRPTNITITYIAPSSGKNPAGLAYSTNNYKVKKGTSFTSPTVTNPNGLTVSYASDNASAVEVNATSGAITIHTVGKAVITASSEATDQYEAGSASYTVYVFDHEGTTADPYSVADARRAIDWNYGTANVYAAGKVSAIVTAYSSQHGNITYNFSTDGTTNADQLQAYRGKGKNGANFTSENDVLVDDEVVVYGSLTKYGSTYEFAADNQLYSRKTKAALSWNGVTANAFAAELNGQNTFPTLVNTNNVDVIYSSSETGVATIIPSTGAISLEGIGSTTITATFEGNENYLANSVSYTLNVSETILTGDITYECNGANNGCPESGLTDQTNLPENLPAVAKDGFNFGGWYKTSTFEETSKVEGGEVITEDVTLYAKWEEPYTVAQARAAIDAGKGITGVYAKGIVSEIVTAFNSQYGNISYNISADGLTTSDQLQAYRGFDKDGDWFTSADDVQVGDEVVIYGNLKKHYSTYEFDQNNQRYSFSRPAPTYTVRFWNSEGWDEVYAYVWKYDAVNEVTTTPVAWPGQATSVVDGWNEFEVEEGYNIIFNNNKSGDEAKQTIDIENITADVCYVLTGETVNTSLAVAADNDCDDRLYVAGDEALTGDNWNTTADRLENGSITFTNIAANTQENPYKFKITNGTWNWNIGGAKVDATACDGVTIEDTDADGNVVFTIDEAKDITISYNKATDKIVVTAVTYVAPVYKAIVVSYGGKYYAMTKTAGNNGFAPLEVTVDGEGNVAVNNEDEKTSILWKFNEGTGTASFQAGTDYLAGNGTSLNLQTAVQDWTLDTADEYYYVMDGTTKRSFFYQTNDNGGIFKNYAVSNFGGEKYSGKHTLYAADKIVIRATAKFFAPASWENVYAYTYSWDEINGTTEYNGAWPGEQLTKDGDWYAISMPIGAKVIFHNNLGGNSNQTVDIPVPASACFAWNGLEYNDNPKMTVATISTCEMNYSIAGNEALTGVAEWGHTALVNNAITYNEVAVGTYKFKISNGTWDWSLGGAYVDQTACSGVTIEDTDGDGNAVFSIATKSNVTISYNPATEKISIVAVASTPEILVDKAEIAFGTVDYEDAVDAELINVTLISVANATISLSGDADAFQLDKDALTASGIVSVTPVTTTAGTFNATLTISDASTAAEAKEIILSLTVNEAPVVDVCDGTDDFDADQSGETATSYKNRITTNGWTATNAQWTTIADEKRYFTINGKTTAVGVITSPVLNGGIASLKFMYANTNNETHGVDVKIEIKQGGDVVKEYTLTKANENVAKGVLYTETIENVNVAGDFQIVFTNLSPTNSDSNKDRVSIGKLCWSNYSAPEPQYETIRENLDPNRYYTICMEKNITAVKNATFWNLRYKNAEPATEVYLEEATTIEAGKPYIFQAGATTLDVIYGDDSKEAPVENGALRGTFEDLTVSQLAAQDGDIYLLIQNAIRPNDGNYLNAHRAYIDYSALTVETPVPAPGRRVRAIPMQSNVVTGCEEINASETPVKMMINGQLFIIRGEKMYDTTGRLVK